MPTTRHCVSFSFNFSVNSSPTFKSASFFMISLFTTTAFVGNLGYVVTFLQLDPLYVVDLSNPAKPVVKGALELLGYSAYLHPVAAGLLLGIGQAVGQQNEPSGMQLELFDVSNPSAPRLQARAALASGSSPVQYDHHAFLFWPPAALAVLPVSIYPTTPVVLSAAPQPLPATGSSAGQARAMPRTGARPNAGRGGRWQPRTGGACPWGAAR